MPRSSVLLLLALAAAASAAGGAALPVLSAPEQLDALERSPQLFALLAVASDTSDTSDDALAAAAAAQFPALARLERELEGVATLALVDVSAHRKALASRWSLPAPPALLVFAEPPQQNPYTHKAYRSPLVVSAELLHQPAKLRKLLRDSVPSAFVAEVAPARVATREALAALVDEHTRGAAAAKIVLLASRQKKPSPLFRALATELRDRGLRFAFVSLGEDRDAAALLAFFGLETLPALLVAESSTTFAALGKDKMKSFKDLKDFVEPFAAEAAAQEEEASEPTGAALAFLTESAFEQQILQSKVVWVVAFTSSREQVAAVEASWQQAFDEVQKKAGMVGFAAVKCADEPALCDKFGGAGVRVFPVKLSPRGHVERADVLPEPFADLASAKEAALASIPDLVQVVRSTPELNAFVSRAAAAKALPVVLFSAKPEVPVVLKSVALSLPSSNVVVAVVLGAAPEVKAQFSLPPTTATAFVCLVVPTDSGTKEPPKGASPFGIVKYDKKTMGSYTYPNMMQFLLSVLSQYPHPKEDAFAADGEALGDAFDASAAASDATLVPYLQKTNLAELCGGSGICAIGFLDGHVDTLSDPESAVSKSLGVLAKVAAASKKGKEPFRFMWTNGRCQQAFAGAFGVGEFQMPTVVVYSPSKSRYAVNVGTFTEENTHGFLKGVLSGKIGTAPVAAVPGLRDECANDAELVGADAAADDGAAEDDDDDDVLSEILKDEQRLRELLEQQLKAEQKEASKDKKAAKKAAKKAKKKTKGKKNKRDEL